MIHAIGINGKPDSKRMGCVDCRYCQAAVTWWCMNKDAQDYRGTLIPGVHSCKFWAPIQMKSDLTWWERFIGAFDVYVDLSKNDQDTPKTNTH